MPFTVPYRGAMASAPLPEPGKLGKGRPRPVLVVAFAGIAMTAALFGTLLNSSPSAWAARLVEAAEHADKTDAKVLTENNLHLDGKVLKLVTGSTVTGRVAMRITQRGLVFAGWAADLKAKKPVEQVVIVVNDIYAQAVPADRPSPGVAQRFGPELAQSGFAVAIPMTMSGAASRSVRFFAILNAGEAMEIPLAKQAQDELKARRAPVRTDG